MAESIHDFFRNPRNKAVIEKLREAGVRMKESGVRSQKTEGAFVGKTVVVTGTLSKFSRDEAKEELRKRGRKRDRQREQEDRLPHRGQRRRLEARQSPRARREDADRERIPGDVVAALL